MTKKTADLHSSVVREAMVCRGGWSQKAARQGGLLPPKTHDVLTCLGLEIFEIGSSAISFHCATHPTVRATANRTVYLHDQKLSQLKEVLTANKSWPQCSVSQYQP